MTEQAKAKIDKLEAEYRHELYRYKMLHPGTLRDEVLEKIDKLSGEIARAYYAGLHS